MAIVANKDGQGIKANGFNRDTDVSYDVPTTSAGTYPAGPSLFASQLQINSATGEVYRSLGAGTTTWAETNIR
jgi:hypothetical protein